MRRDREVGIIGGTTRSVRGRSLNAVIGKGGVPFEKGFYSRSSVGPTEELLNMVLLG